MSKLLKPQGGNCSIKIASVILLALIVANSYVWHKASLLPSKAVLVSETMTVSLTGGFGDSHYVCTVMPTTAGTITISTQP